MPRAAPTVQRSYVVEIAPPGEGCDDGITAHIRPAEHTAAAAEHGFRFSDDVLDAVAALLVEIAREEGDDGGEP